MRSGLTGVIRAAMRTMWSSRFFALAASWACLGLPSSAWAVTAMRAPYSRVDPATKREKTIDPDAIWLENEHLKLAIVTVPPHAGQILSLVYKPTGQELCNPMTLQGYWQDRGVPGRMTRSEGDILSQSDDQAQVRVTYVNEGEQDGAKFALRHAKTYTLKKDASFILVDWKQENVGPGKVMYNPWIKQVGGCGETVLNGPWKIPVPEGTIEGGWDVEPAANWIARLSGKQDSETAPMAVSLTDFRRIFRQCTWSKPPRYTMETTLTRADLKAGEAIEVPTALLVAPNLAEVLYAAPELAASLTASGEVKPGQAATFTVNIAAGQDLGEKRLEGQVVNANGEIITKLPNRQVQLKVGKISKVKYDFTPPQDGVYYLELTVFDRQTPLRLGESVKSQKTYITLPIVVGPRPAVVVRKWESEDKGFPGRKEQQVKPWRTLVRSDALKVGQVLVPERIFPEDKFIFGEKVEPAAIRLAGGEYECLQFLVDLPEQVDPMALSVAVSPIKNDVGEALEKAILREQIYLTTEIPSDFRDFAVGQWPDPLFETDWPTKIPNAPITKQNIEHIRKCDHRVFWLTVRAQPDARPGLYKGTVKLALNGKPAGEFPVEVKVNDFALSRRATLRCSTGMVGWRANRPDNWKTLGLGDEEISAITKNAMDSYRRLILEYGWSPTMFGGGVKFWEAYDKVGRGLSVFTGGANKEGEQWLIERGLLKYAIIYAPFDEHTDGKVPEVVEWAKKWKAEHKIPILDCYYGSNVKPLFGLVDVWLGQSPLSSWWGKPTGPLGWGHLAVERKKAGDQFMSCNASLQWHVEFDPAPGRAQFWDDFAAGVDGRYVYSTCRWTDDVYKKNWTTGNYMGCVVYPGPHGLTTSIRMETLRDAVEDYDYLAILRDTVAKAEAAGKAPAALVAEAKAIIDNQKLAEKVKTAENINRMRNRVADLIEKLAE
ncbi:MAG TPA: hypothetical protein DCX07_07195 [Phycisphaerales bacterium]|nr:hypothetical protein [Phycisphaerales bacterium]